MSQAERAALLTRAPTIIDGLTDAWPARRLWTDPQRFSARFGHHEVKAVRSGHGFVQIAKRGGAHCTAYDEEACPAQANATLSFAELVAHSEAEQIVLMDLEDMAKGEHRLLTDLSTEYELPEFLESISNLRLLSLGGRPEGVQMSRHDAAWLAVVVGAKLWHLAPPDRPKPADRSCAQRGKVDYALAAAEGVTHCIAHPGEVVVVPDGWWHATCNLAPYTLAIGGQTWDAHAGPLFGARGPQAREATAERWRNGAPRSLNAYQSRIDEHLIDGQRIS